MSLQKLPKDIQSLFCASQLCSYKRAIEELIYNALDADSTSIAIRVNIEDNSMQVIDNGCGISKKDFKLLGQRHATSKYVDLATLKSAPNKYGFRGLSLASIIDVSKSVNITSRFSNSEDTWAKNFYKGKEQKLCEASQRPSKGTTVDIKGFLYNLKIQKKAVESLKELNDIKNILEQLSLVHNNISISLRDDGKNEIVFKLHKNRHIYQTLSSVFEIDKKDVQEFKVDKGNYKVTAYIGKRDNETSQKRWIYLNGKLLQHSKINKVMNNTLTKTLKLNLQLKTKVKSKNPYNQEDLSKCGIPFYFIFIACPYYDYDLNVASKHTVVEFKHWDQVNKLLDKLAKLYAGDNINLPETEPLKMTIRNIDVENTRDEVKKIMDRILGSNQRKIGVSQMQKGIKGKITKRKSKKQTTKLSLAKVIPNNTIGVHKEMGHNHIKCNLEINNYHVKHENKIAQQNKKERRENKTENIKLPKQKNTNTRIVCESKPKQFRDKVTQKSAKKVIDEKRDTMLIDKTSVAIKNTKENLNQISKRNKLDNPTICIKKVYIPKQNIEKSIKKKNLKVDNILKKFKDDPTGSVKKRCHDLSKKIVEIMNCKKKRKRKVFINETVQYSNIVKDNKKYSVRKKIGEIVIHDYVPKPIGVRSSSYDRRIRNKIEVKPRPEKEDLSSYDLIRTVLKTQETKNTYIEAVCSEIKPIPNSPENNLNPSSNVMKTESPAIAQMPKLTYESHNYSHEKYINRITHEYDFVNRDDVKDYEYRKKLANNIRFITTQSRDNFLIPQAKDIMRRKNNKLSHLNNFGFRRDCCGNSNKSMSCASSYSIEFSKTNEEATNCHLDYLRRKSNTEPIIKETYTLEHDPSLFEDPLLRRGCTYTIIDDSLENVIDTRIADEHECIQCLDESKDRESTNQGTYTHEFMKEHSIQGDYNTESRETSELENMNVVFVSKSQEPEPYNERELSLDRNVIPLDVCETVHSCEDVQESKDNRKINDSLFNDDLEIDSFLCDRNAYPLQNFPDLMDLDDIIIEDPLNEVADAEHYDTLEDVNLEEHNKNKQIFEQFCANANENIEFRNGLIAKTADRFNFKDRLRFVPKGMSQIFQNCQTKNLCDDSVNQDYFGKTIYNKFSDDVRENAKIYEPEVQNAKELATKAVDKVKIRLSKDHASLVFDGDDIKNAKVLAQIDNKFIAAKLTGRAHRSCEEAEYVVLFDQHAVHERIRLESNLSDYQYNNHWKSTPLDDITLKLSKDEILYLHNYKDKFIQLGLDWTVRSTGEVSLKAIPEAIIGKNPRQVEIVMKSVKNLIIEEINAIKAQSGCISLYPKAIMELVFSEACRYAIKFGDKLSMNECADLLNSLAECKTPFQCAHGRPVMAVLIEVRNETKKYKANLTNVSEWIKRRQK